MNKFLKWSLLLAATVTVGCSDEIVPPASDTVVRAYEGDDVVFSLANNNAKSRTQYGDTWYPSAGASQVNELYWGNYIDALKDSIRIYCRESVGNAAVYKVNPTQSPSSTAIDISKAADVAIQWGKQGIDYNFYAFYPASQSSDAFVGSEGHVIEAQILNGQMPTMYKYGDSTGPNKGETSLQQIAEVGTGGDEPYHVYAMPDMEAAIMMARTPVGTDGYGLPVSLDFSVLADVLDITINGPITPNRLGGNSIDQSKKFIKILGVDVKATDGSLLAGKFKLDMDAEEDKNRVIPTTGVSTVQVLTVDKGQYVTLYARDQDNDDASMVDKLHLRVFIMPDQVKDLNKLIVVVRTDCGDYEQELASDPNVNITGKIYRVKMPRFDQRGKEFDYSSWMGQLDPNIYITELSIPGAWHASNPLNQGEVASQDLQMLYDEGIRAFEIHTGNINKPLQYFYEDNKDLTKLFDAKTSPYFDKKYNETQLDGKWISSFNQSKDVIDASKSETWGWVATSRTVYSTPIELTVSKAVSSYDQKPKFSLRLYRKRNISPTGTVPEGLTPLSDAIAGLQDIMNPNAFLFFEFGMNGARAVDVKYRTVTRAYTTTYTVRLKGTQERRLLPAREYDPTWTQATLVEAEDYKEINETNFPVEATTLTETYTYDKDLTVSAAEAWAVAIETCINRLKTKEKNGKIFLYTEPIKSTTTISDVQGHLIVKVNTNGAINEDDGAISSGTNESAFGWESPTEAIFSRWMDPYGTKRADNGILTINAQWGAPIAPFPLDTTNPMALHWCFSELDNVGTETLLASRKTSINDYISHCYKEYMSGLHRTFFSFSVGGYYGGTWDESGCQNLAKELNPYMIEAMTNPANPNTPFGIVFMNYAVAPDEATYRSEELIRTIINNNSAFLLNRKPTGDTPAAENTNSSFRANPRTPFK